MKNETQRNFINTLKLKPAQQICIVTYDLKKTASYYEKLLDLRPFIFPKITYKKIMYLGKTSSGCWEMAFARMGHIEIELAKSIKPPNLYEDFLKKHGEGLHHLGFEVADLDESIKDSDCIILITDHDMFKNIDPLEISKLMRNKNVVDARSILDINRWQNAGFKVKVLGDGK